MASDRGSRRAVRVIAIFPAVRYLFTWLSLTTSISDDP